MSKVKVQCSFCGKTNTKMVKKYASSGFLGLGSTEIGQVEEVDPDAEAFYRCAGCGKIYCSEHYDSLCRCVEHGFLRTRRWYECPKCGCTKIVKI